MIRGRDGLAILAATLAAVMLALVAMDVHLLDGVEDQTVAMRFHARGPQKVDDVAVVAIDDVTFSDLEAQWPFRRSLHARAIDALRRAGAKQIVYDVQFTEPTAEREDLALFRAVERAGGVVLATTETDGHGGTNVLGGDANVDRAGAHAAAANLETDPGGVIHRFPYASGGLRSVGVVTTELITGRSLSPRSFDRDGAWIDYAGPRGTVPTVSFSDLVSGRADTDLLRGRIVVVGATAPTLQDVHSTPTSTDRLMSGPEIQANAISTALHGLPLRDAPAWTAILALLLLGCAPALAHLLTRGLKAAAISPVLALAFALLAQGAFGAGVVVPVTYPLLALALGTLTTMIVAFLSERRALDRVSGHNDLLEQRVRERTAQLRDTQLEIVRRLGQAAESRDRATGDHIERISRLSHRLALAIGLPEDEAELIGHAAAMHDVGKIGIPDSVLLKPSSLDPDEWQLMRTHTSIGATILSGSSSPLLQMAESVALTHHERWDGGGYPAGLRGEQIPLAARICTVCDVFDALLSARHYKPRWLLDAAVAELVVERGRQFDPALIDAFVALVPDLDEDLVSGSEMPLAGVLTLGAEREHAAADQSTPAGASERSHSRNTSPPTRA
jgi:HD-GYP domain-containing protein (c-di-GMP phosphodiesterase class II)/CHASE2 domain-containing sensor protein